MKLAPDVVLADRYRLGVRLGRGGMGEVWSAVHVVTGRRVAIKRLLVTADQDHDGEARARFVREAQTACAVDHPNVVEILDFLDTGDEPPLLVMELLSGETLADLLTRKSSLGVERTAKLLLPVVSAVGTAHARGIIHRDLKPANIFLHERTDSERLVKVLDFGIAKWFAARASASDPRTKSGSTLGTPCYMAPEQAIGQREITHRADIWSIGVICYECLAGSRPVEGENAAQVVMSLLHTGIIPIVELVPTIPRELAQIIGRMLSRDPAGRPEDLRETFAVLASLTRATAPSFGAPEVPLETEPEPRKSTQSTPLVAWAPRAPSSVSGSAETALAQPLRASRHRLKGWHVAGAGLALVALVLTFAATRSNAPATQISPVAPGPPFPAAAAASLAEPPSTVTALPMDSGPPPVTSGSPVTPKESPRRRRAVASAPASTTLPAAGLPNGSRCQRSRECTSGLCVAFTCQ